MRPPAGRRMRRPGPARMRAGLPLLLVVVLGVAAVPAWAGTPPTPWDGTNPFHCVLQDAGLGTKVPDPGADPYCVFFDKTHQNISQGGIVDFVSKEPARTAAASPKCFYFQEDHWRSSVVQSNQQTEVYEWVGHYFFNKATGDGGVWIEGFNVNGHTFDPTQVPGFPPQDGQYFGPGTGGFITHDEVPVDPACVALAKHEQVYSSSHSKCIPDAGRIKRRALGPITLGRREDSVRAELGSPGAVERGYLRYCVAGGGSYLVGEHGDRSGTLGANGTKPALILATTARGFIYGHLHVGSRLTGHGRRVRRGLVALRLRRGVLALVSHRRVQELVVYNPRAITNWRNLRGFLRRSR
jgi:hypothetical protein